MSTEVKHRRGTTVEHSTFTGAVGEITVDTTKGTAVVHNGVTAGGFPLTKNDASEEFLGNAATATLADTATLATSANTLNSGMVTIASHATTADIFAAAGNTIEWTGTATTTAFPAAPKAGMTRTLYCTGASKFTSGANLLIVGFNSGSTVTMKAGAIVKVTAITTTQFKLEYTLSGTTTATGVGFTTSPTATVNYTVVNGLVSLTVGQISATSGGVAYFQLDISEPAINPNTGGAEIHLGICGAGLDNGTACSIYVTWDGSTFHICKNTYAGKLTWNTSANKRFYNMMRLNYHLGVL